MSALEEVGELDSVRITCRDGAVVEGLVESVRELDQDDAVDQDFGPDRRLTLIPQTGNSDIEPPADAVDGIEQYVAEAGGDIATVTAQYYDGAAYCETEKRMISSAEVVWDHTDQPCPACGFAGKYSRFGFDECADCGHEWGPLADHPADSV